MSFCEPISFDLVNEAATIRMAELVAPKLAPGNLVILSGPLGSGKTFFTRALCHALGLPKQMRVPSPTFTLVQEHPTRPPVAHADVYRLQSAEDVERLGLDSQREDGFIVVVEWGEPFIDILGSDALIIAFTLDPRTAKLSCTGPSSSKLLEAMRDS